MQSLRVELRRDVVTAGTAKRIDDRSCKDRRFGFNCVERQSRHSIQLWRDS